MPPSFSGALRGLILFEIAEGVRLEAIRPAVHSPVREPNFSRPAPGYVRFESPPVEERLGALDPGSDESYEVRLRYYDAGVVCVELELRAEGPWSRWLELSARWFTQVDSFVRRAEELVRAATIRHAGAFVRPYDTWIDEDYLILFIERRPDLPAQELLAQSGAEIAQLVRGETQPLSAGEAEEILSSARSYYPSDLLVTAWGAAFVYDDAAQAAPTLQLLEHANLQLIEFRRYDEILTRVLADVYRLMDRGTGPVQRWRLRQEAARLNAIRLDVAELAERQDNSIKFLSDMFEARAHRLMLQRVGASDWRRLVDEKLRTGRELYEFLVNEFHHARSFVLESMIVLILIIDLYYLFREKGL
jgi:hypothetical protein